VTFFHGRHSHLSGGSQTEAVVKRCPLDCLAQQVGVDLSPPVLSILVEGLQFFNFLLRSSFHLNDTLGDLPDLVALCHRLVRYPSGVAYYAEVEGRAASQVC